MESLPAGPIINPCIFGEEHLNVESLEQESSDAFGYCIANTDSLSFEEEEGQYFQIPSFDNKLPFLQMLQSHVESPSPFSPFTEPQSFQALLRLQHRQIKRPWDQKTNYNLLEMDTGSTSPIKQGLQEPESCLTHDVLDVHESPVRSETKNHRHSTSCYGEWVSYQEQPNSPPTALGPVQTSLAASAPAKNNNNNYKEKRKRKRTSSTPSKGKETAESQRVTHIAVERNRRRLMNDHLCALRSLMPPSYVQRGDQASIIGGAIDFVKELEQLLQTLEAQKRMRKADQDISAKILPQQEYRLQMKLEEMEEGRINCCKYVEDEGERISSSNTNSSGSGELFRAERKSGAAEVQVRVIQNHVNLKIECGRRAGQLVIAIVALEELRLTVLHLNITSLETSLLYSFSLKIEEDCKVGSADEIAGAVHQIFSFISGGSNSRRLSSSGY